MDTLNGFLTAFNCALANKKKVNSKCDHSENTLPNLDKEILNIQTALKASSSLQACEVAQLRSLIRDVKKFEVYSTDHCSNKMSILFNNLQFCCSSHLFDEFESLISSSVWNSYLERHTTLNKSGSFSKNLFINSTEELKSYLMDCGKHVTKLNLSDLLEDEVMKELDALTLESFLSLCPNLKKLKLEDAFTLNDKDIEVVVKRHTSLEKLTLPRSEQITVLGMKRLKFCANEKELESTTQVSREATQGLQIRVQEAKRIQTFVTEASSLPKINSSPTLPIKRFNGLIHLKLPDPYFVASESEDEALIKPLESPSSTVVGSDTDGEPRIFDFEL